MPVECPRPVTPHPGAIVKRGHGHISEELWAPFDLGSLSFTLLNGRSAFTAAFRYDPSEWSSLRVPTCRSTSPLVSPKGVQVSKPAPQPLASFQAPRCPSSALDSSTTTAAKAMARLLLSGAELDLPVLPVCPWLASHYLQVECPLNICPIG